MAQFDYFYPDGADQFTFYRIPKRLFTDNDLKTMSNGSKILYGLLLDRVDLSVKNRWMDDHRRIYVVYTLESIMQAMNVTDKPATKMLVELEKRGLIERKKPGLGRPTRLYVKNFSSKEASPEILRLQTRRNSDSGVGERVRTRRISDLIITILMILSITILIISYPDRMRWEKVLCLLFVPVGRPEMKDA